MNKKLINLGFSERFLQESTLYKGLFLGRVVAQYKDLYNVATEKSEVLSEISGKLRYSSDELSDYPAVGDFVMVDREEELHGNAIIHKILTRKSIFVRRAAGTSHDVQVIATNIDTVFICMSLNNDFNLRRLERYLSIAWDSGAIPVVVLTKSDLCEDLPERLAEIEKVATGVDILVTSSITEDGYSVILKYISPGLTVAFMGSSVIDTPGMREIGVESVNLVKTFADIEEFSERCRFKDCLHENEPGCSIRKAIAEGMITEERLQNYKKLKKEAKYEGLNSRQIEKEKITGMFADFGGIKNARDYIKSKSKK